MKFVHIADVHFDMPFSTLATRGLAQKRRLEQRNAFKNVIQYIRENAIEYFFICGDLYEQKYVKQSTIQFISQLFETIPQTKIFLIPGNHDPLIKNSYYQTFSFPQNVKIFKGNVEKIETDHICIYGYGFEDYYQQDKIQEEWQIEDKNKINILLTHGDLDGEKNNNERYNSIAKRKLKSLGFDYVALGHIHKPSYEDEIVYPGSLISLGFDELRKPSV